MIFDLNVTSKSIDVQIVDDDGLPVTGLVASTFPTVKYSKAGANADVTITLADLATITTAWASGGVKERGEGVYRLDLPDAVFTATGWVKIRGETSGKRLICETLEVSPQLTGTTVGTVSALAAAALDNITTTAPSGVASNFREMVVQTWRRFFKKATQTETQIITYADNGTTVVTTQTVSDDGTTETQGAAS